MNKKFYLLFILIIVFSFFGCKRICDHEFLDPTCTEKEMCKKCGFINRNALGHDFIKATFDKPMICKRCGITYGEPLKEHEHQFLKASCIYPKRCECGYSEGESLGHDEEVIFPNDAECLIPVMAKVVCKRCESTL